MIALASLVGKRENDGAGSLGAQTTLRMTV